MTFFTFVLEQRVDGESKYMGEKDDKAWWRCLILINEDE